MPDSRKRYSLDISEFALLENGQRVILHAERGLTSQISSGDIWAHTTLESITPDVLAVVRPDDDDSLDEHPWEWLAQRARAKGIDVTADELRRVPYEVVFAERLVRRVSERGG